MNHINISSGFVPLTNNEYTNSELKTYSTLLNVFASFGIFFHFVVLAVLSYRQIKSRFFSVKSKESFQKSNNPYIKNYVTFAFVLHQILIDFFRLVYALFYSNSLLIDSKKYMSIMGRMSSEVITVDASKNSLYFHTIYEKYCSQMALF
jgi:hypothetical protein